MIARQPHKRQRAVKRTANVEETAVSMRSAKDGSCMCLNIITVANRMPGAQSTRAHSRVRTDAGKGTAPSTKTKHGYNRGLQQPQGKSPTHSNSKRGIDRQAEREAGVLIPTNVRMCEHALEGLAQPHACSSSKIALAGLCRLRSMLAAAASVLWRALLPQSTKKPK